MIPARLQSKKELIGLCLLGTCTVPWCTVRRDGEKALGRYIPRCDTALLGAFSFGPVGRYPVSRV